MKREVIAATRSGRLDTDRRVARPERIPYERLAIFLRKVMAVIIRMEPSITMLAGSGTLEEVGAAMLEPETY